MVDQLDAENRLANSLTPDPHGHLRPALEAVALIQQALSGTRQVSRVERPYKVKQARQGRTST